MKNNFYFHGTRKAFLKTLLKEGLKTKYGRATLTLNPVYTSYYSSESTKGSVKKAGIKPIIKEGVLVAFKIPEKNIEVAKDSHITIRKREKIITGWPNRYKTEQHGYYTDKKKRYVCLDKKYIVAVFSYNKLFLKVLEKVRKTIIMGKANERFIKNSIEKLEKILSDKKIQHITPKTSLRDISHAAVYGTIRNIVLREIRQSELSLLVLNGWKIENMGDHPVKLKNKKEVEDSIRNIGKIINWKFIPKDARKEYFELREMLDKN